MDQNTIFVSFAKKTVKGAGQILLTYKEKYTIKKTKDLLNLDIATNADYASEEFIVQEIKKQFPSHSILTEETNTIDKHSPYEWIIDPLDGTKEFVRHIPYYYVLLALEYEGKLLVSAGYQPEIKRLFSAAIGSNPTVNGKQMIVSETNNISKSMVYITLNTSYMTEDDLDLYFGLVRNLAREAYKIRNTAWDIEALYNVSMGAGEAHIIPATTKKRGPKWWDIAPGVLAVETGGGMISDFSGNKIENRDLSRGLVASNGKIHEKLLQMIKSVYSHKNP